MSLEQKRVSSGIRQLDRLLDGLFIGDNVLWYDDAGSLASVFCMNFIRESQSAGKPIIYVSFDRSPKNLLTYLGALGEDQNLIILDCFTNGKGDRSEVFNKFYEKDGAQWPHKIIRVNTPADPEKVAEAIYGVHKTMSGDVRFIIESLTGMQDLWGGEEQIIKFYSRSCPRLYELDTIAYWILEKGAHSGRLKAKINQIAQVAVDLSLKRGKSALTVLKAENRNPILQNEPCHYFCQDNDIVFEIEKQHADKFDLGAQIKGIRKQRGLSQKELAKMIGVTASTISQVESNLIYPSLPALYRIAEALSVEMASFFRKDAGNRKKMVFHPEDRVKITFPAAKNSIRGESLLPLDLETRADPYLIEIPPRKKLSAHFFIHKGEEIGYLLSGQLAFTAQNERHELRPGAVVYLQSETPESWHNSGEESAKLLWFKIN